MGKSASSISSVASDKASSLSSSATKSASSASLAAASASASAAGKNPTIATTSTTAISTTLIAITSVIAILVGLHFSGALDPFYKFVAEKYFKAEAKAELKVLEKTGSAKLEGAMKDRLKSNPAADLGEGELNDVAKGNADIGKLAGGVGDKFGL